MRLKLSTVAGAPAFPHQFRIFKAALKLFICFISYSPKHFEMGKSHEIHVSLWLMVDWFFCTYDEYIESLTWIGNNIAYDFLENSWARSHYCSVLHLIETGYENHTSKLNLLKVSHAKKKKKRLQPALACAAAKMKIGSSEGNGIRENTEISPKCSFRKYEKYEHQAEVYLSRWPYISFYFSYWNWQYAVMTLLLLTNQTCFYHWILVLKLNFRHMQKTNFSLVKYWLNIYIFISNEIKVSVWMCLYINFLRYLAQQKYSR